MSEARSRRIESEIQRTLAALIAREVKDPRVGNVTITAVKMAADMGTARIYFTPFASRESPEQVRAALTHAASFLRGEVGRSPPIVPRTAKVGTAATTAAAEPPMPSGILLLDKPLGLSSNAALQRVRRLFQGAKAGHAGSLDPLATGMLPICIGEATKIAGDIVAGAKHYRFSIALGTATASADAEGEVTARAPVPDLTPAQVAGVLAGFRGERSQVPPMYSAIKQGGQPLYRLARAGRIVERAPRAIEIYEIALIALAADSLEVEVSCSKGTYVRVLAEEIAAALGTVGHVSALRRLSVEPFADLPMLTLENLEQAGMAQCAAGLLPADYPLRHLAAVSLSRDGAARLLKGQAVLAAGALSARLAEGESERVRIYDEAGSFLGIGVADALGALRPKRLLNRDA